LPEIPPSPYPVLRDPIPAKRTIAGPWIASKPAYQMFAEMAAGKSLSDIIAEDQRAQAKAEGRPDPVEEHPENAHFWVQGGGGDHDATSSAPASTPDTAPAPPTTLPTPLTVAPVPMVPPVVLPVPTAAPRTTSATPPPSAPPVAAPPSVPVAEAASAVGPLVKSASLGGQSVPIAFFARNASRPTDAADTRDRQNAAAARGGRPQPTTVTRQVAYTSYTKGSHQTRVAARVAAHRSTPKVI
jgi:hypothetical protein